MTAVFRVREPGAYTTVQDRGRFGFQQFGVPVSGALDVFSSFTANMLVGNSDDAAVLECTFLGPVLEVISDCVLAVTGAEVPLFVNDRPQPLWESFKVRSGDHIAFKAATSGVRSYLAAAGGIDVPVVMGSRSTYVRAKIGGMAGRPLARGDVLSRGEGPLPEPHRMLPDELRPGFGNRITLRAIRGPQDGHFDRGLDVFFQEEYHVTAQADRMGYRLAGPVVPFREGMPAGIISEPNMPGAVQVPPDGLPIVILVEHTVGGYAKIACVITPDLDLIAQARPGDIVRFREINLTDAHQCYRVWTDRLNGVRHLPAS